MKGQFLAWLAWFDARNKRERTIIAVAAVFLVLFLGDALLLSSPLIRSRAQIALAEQHENEAANLSQQLQVAQSELASSAANRAQVLQVLKSRVASLDGQLKSFDGTLVSPQAAPALLERLMGRRKSLQMLGLRTVAPVPAIDGPSAASTPELNLYRHGIEIRLAGSYGDLLGYLADLESAPERLLWEGAELKVDVYPRSILTLRVYTLSLDKAWLVL